MSENKEFIDLLLDLLVNYEVHEIALTTTKVQFLICSKPVTAY